MLEKGISGPKHFRMSKKPLKTAPKIEFYSFWQYDIADIRFGPRLTEVPHFRLNRIRADGCWFNAH